MRWQGINSNKKRKGGIQMLNQVETPQTMKKVMFAQATTQIDSTVTPEKQAHYWYGGEMATIEAGGYKFHIEAIGDVYADLFKPSSLTDEALDWDNCIEHIKDKRNGGAFGEIISYYIKNDEELAKLMDDGHPVYRLKLDYANWWECSVTDPEGSWHDLMWNLDATGLNDAIEEVLEALQDGLEIDNVVLQLTA